MQKPFIRHDRTNKNWKKNCAVKIIFLIIEKLNKINTKKNAKAISTFDLSTFYTSIPHYFLLLNENIK